MLSENLKYLSLAIFTFAYSSQIYKILETNSVDSLSIVMNFLILIGISISLYQYIKEKSVYGIVSSLIGVTYYIGILILIAYYI